ncbi:hypothetical protein AMS68_004117 [Peltaster fructicola]|uniref:SUN domain-containing protein n=1 Tax=Peltaster fructicola TaxID=286661 RepID=A0A6H0XVX6_9PEZI|nr:hypothetical protein AMS68_004117 [Peltaster fructicola]
MPASTIVHISATLDGSTETDVDSPLDNANFLSFEEWKKQNLAKAGQSGDNIGNRQQFEPGRRQANVNALDSLGEESEIDLDFTGFGGASVKPKAHSEHSTSSTSATVDDTEVSQASPASQALRPRDAGKTCKERTNYASFDCAATILKSNKECKSASSVLVENKDSYMLNKCSASNKYIIVELCNDILVDTVVLANYEFFSSIFRTFRVSVSDRYPAKAEKWKDLGTFVARNTREVQAFLIENPLIWARYLRIEFLTHYGSEYYCPLSLLRVHGTTMMEEFRNQEELARGEAQDDESVVEPIDTMEAVVTAVTPLPESSLVEKNVDNASSPTNVTEVLSDRIPSVSTTANASVASAADHSDGVYVAFSVMSEITSTISTCRSDSTTPAIQTTSSATTSISVVDTTNSGSPSAAAKESSSASSAAPTESAQRGSSFVASSSIQAVPSSATSSSNTSAVTSMTATAVNSSTASVNSTELRNTTQTDVAHKASSNNSTKSSSSTAPHAQPSTQESFFKSISKRLQQLESNSTLSLQYIEEQSRILRDAFSKVEKRQISTTTSFLANLNNTVMAELAGFRQAYDQLWQSTVIELESQREQHQREMTALSSRLTLVVDELVWQKRMGIVQSTLLLLCIGLVLFARPGNTWEASLAQQVMARSQAAFRSGTASDQHSPSDGRSPVSLFRRKLPLWRKDAKSTERSDDASLSPAPDSPIGLESPIEGSPLSQALAYDEDEAALSEASIGNLSI